MTNDPQDVSELTIRRRLRMVVDVDVISSPIRSQGTLTVPVSRGDSAAGTEVSGEDAERLERLRRALIADEAALGAFLRAEALEQMESFDVQEWQNQLGLADSWLPRGLRQAINRLGDEDQAYFNRMMGSDEGIDALEPFWRSTNARVMAVQIEEVASLER